MLSLTDTGNLTTDMKAKKKGNTPTECCETSMGEGWQVYNSLKGHSSRSNFLIVCKTRNVQRNQILLANAKEIHLPGCLLDILVHRKLLHSLHSHMPSHQGCQQVNQSNIAERLDDRKQHVSLKDRAH